MTSTAGTLHSLATRKESSTVIRPAKMSNPMAKVIKLRRSVSHIMSCLHRFAQPTQASRHILKYVPSAMVLVNDERAAELRDQIKALEAEHKESKENK